MINSAARLLLLALLTTALLPGCARYSAEGRSQRAYAKYVRESRAGRAKQQTKARRAQQEIPASVESAPTESITTSDDG